MPAAGFAFAGTSAQFGGRITPAVVITCVVAATSGLIFGYDVGISGGVTMMGPFLEKFFPSILTKAAMAKPDMYCVYDSEVLTAVTSSLYIAGLVSSPFASRFTRLLGRRNSMVIGGCIFLAGAAIDGAAEHVAMLIIGRLLLGFGVGFTNQATPVYLSEVAPPKWRGAFNTAFQFFINVGVLCANCLNYAVSKYSYGWRISLGGAVVPAAIMTAGALIISDSPSGLVERGMIDEARKSLANFRGDSDIDSELNYLIKCNDDANVARREPFFTIFEKQYRPHLVMSAAIPFFQQLTGVGIVAFYAPVLFQSVGFGSDSSSIAAIILGVVTLASISVSSCVVDRLGRRFMFVFGGVLMFLCQIGAAIVLASTAGTDGSKQIPQGFAVLVLVLMCIYSAGFGWSWGPLTWLVPSEILPMNVRPAGQSISVAVNFATTFVLAQAFLAMLCRFKFAIFLFYAGWVVVMTLFVILFLPETKGIPMDSMQSVWASHWFWRRYVRHY